MVILNDPTPLLQGPDSYSFCLERFLRQRDDGGKTLFSTAIDTTTTRWTFESHSLMITQDTQSLNLWRTTPAEERRDGTDSGFDPVDWPLLSKNVELSKHPTVDPGVKERPTDQPERVSYHRPKGPTQEFLGFPSMYDKYWSGTGGVS